MPNRCIYLHSKHPQPTIKAVSLSAGRFLHRSAQYIAGVPVAGFVIAAHTMVIVHELANEQRTLAVPGSKVSVGWPISAGIFLDR